MGDVLATLWAVALGLWPVPLFVAFFLVLEWSRQGFRTAKSFRNAISNLRFKLTHDIATAILAPLSSVAPLALQRQIGVGWIDLGLSNPQTLVGQALAVALVLLLYDFTFYWWHRLQHSHWLLFAGHRLHHSDEHMEASTSVRGHWIEAFYSPFVATLPIVILFKPIGAPSTALWFVGALIGYWAHADLRVSLGPWFISPQYHLIHHSSLPEHQGKNLAGILPVWDILFGTYWRAEKWEYPPSGLGEGDRDAGFLAAQCAPFRIWFGAAAALCRKKRRPIEAA